MNESIFRILAAVILVTAMVISSYFRMKIEKFGDEYREYIKRTGRFLPKIL